MNSACVRLSNTKLYTKQVFFKLWFFGICNLCFCIPANSTPEKTSAEFEGQLTKEMGFLIFDQGLMFNFWL